MFRHIFNGLESRYAEELKVIRSQYPSEPVQFTEAPLVIHWAEGMQMLRDAGHQVGWCYFCSLSNLYFVASILGEHQFVCSLFENEAKIFLEYEF